MLVRPVQTLPPDYQSAYKQHVEEYLTMLSQDPSQSPFSLPPASHSSDSANGLSKQQQQQADAKASNSIITMLKEILQGSSTIFLSTPPPKPNHAIITINLMKSIYWQGPVTTPLRVIWDELWAVRKYLVKKSRDLNTYALVLFSAPYMVLPLDATLQELGLTNGVIRLESRGMQMKIVIQVIIQTYTES